MLSGDPSPGDRSDRMRGLMTLLGSVTRLEVDVVILNAAPLPLVGRVLTTGRMIHRRDAVALGLVVVLAISGQLLHVSR